jgi:hypothetical protein
MLFLLRKIGGKTIQKKIADYLLYTIGEIVLVVIGILIAVSIDDWNSENKKKANRSACANIRIGGKNRSA